MNSCYYCRCYCYPSTPILQKLPPRLVVRMNRHKEMWNPWCSMQIQGVNDYKSSQCILMHYQVFFVKYILSPRFQTMASGTNQWTLRAEKKAEVNRKRVKEGLAENFRESWDQSLPQADPLMLWGSRAARSPSIFGTCCVLEPIGIKLFHQAVL